MSGKALIGGVAGVAVGAALGLALESPLMALGLAMLFGGAFAAMGAAETKKDPEIKPNELEE